MMDATSDLAGLLDCLSARLPALRDALLRGSHDELAKVELAAGDRLLAKGEAAQALYIVAAGRLRATVTQEDGGQLTLSEFGPGELAGEMAILAGEGEYGATVSAMTDAVLVKVPREAFERIVKPSPQVVREMAGGIRRRMARDQLTIGLSRLFGALDDAMLRFVESRVESIRLHAGEQLFAAGDKAEDLYFVVGGRLRALAEDGRMLSEMTRGESIGEMALLTGEPRTATVVAVRDSELIYIGREAFDEIVARYPQIMRTIARIVVRRLRAKERQESETSARCIAVVAAAGGMPTSDFCERLVRGLETVGPTLHLSAARFDSLLLRPGIADADEEVAAGIRLTAWLDEQESKYRFLIYEADAGASAWTRRCLRQADEIVLVAQAGSDVAPGEVEKSLLGAESRVSQARRTLVLLHPDGSRLPSGTARWFEGRNIRQHFHIRLDTEADFQRVARCLAGVATGLVLGGGGARGIAHVGVIRALREAKVPIDMIGGTSMGAVIASLAAMDQDWKKMIETNRDAWIRRKPHTEYGPPIISLVRSRRLDSMAQHIWGDACIEDLWVNFFCVSCNLSTSEMQIHERGSLWKAIRASASLPGVFVPVLDNGSILVDGGIVNNLPGDVMRERSCRLVVVVDVGSDREFTFKFPEIPSPWKFLYSRIFPFTKRVEVPNIADVLMRTTDVGSSQKTREVKKDADLCLRPPVDGFGTLQFEALDAIADVGYRYTKEKLVELRSDTTLQGLFPPSGTS
jgi:predicted acylesterase/phospholipase RssA/CRP-like cAMP-binding protein